MVHPLSALSMRLPVQAVDPKVTACVRRGGRGTEEELDGQDPASRR
jgi:hypothetical protein